MTDAEYGELDEASIFRALTDHDVEFVVVGGGAALLWGAERGTRDIDCVAQQSTENYQRLCAALVQMGRPRLRIEGVDDETATELSEELLHPDFFARTATSTWRTDAGALTFSPPSRISTVSMSGMRNCVSGRLACRRVRFGWRPVRWWK